MILNTLDEHRVVSAFHAWQAGDLDKFDFYNSAAVRRVGPRRVSEIVGISEDVVRDRLNYLRQLA
jgi:hypothetical protein